MQDEQWITGILNVTSVVPPSEKSTILLPFVGYALIYTRKGNMWPYISVQIENIRQNNPGV